MRKYRVYATEEFTDWLKAESLKSQKQVQNRVFLIEDEGYFGHHKYLEDADVWELKFNDGRRIYYTVIQNLEVVLLLGGNKNGQEKDIRQASKIFKKIQEIRSRQSRRPPSV